MHETVKDSEWYRQKFLYPNGTLKNKLNITDAAELAQKEYFGSGIRAVAFLRKNKKITSIEDLKKIHKIMFGWLYDWAGEIFANLFSMETYQDKEKIEFLRKHFPELIASFEALDFYIH